MVKTIKNIILIFVCMLVVLPLGFSTTFDELINSYDFSYDTNQISNLTIISQGIDTNNNSLYDKLQLNLNFQNQEGNYTFNAKLYNNKNLKTYKTYTNQLNQGQTHIKLNFNSQIIDNKEYTLQLQIYKDNQLIYRNYNATTINLNLSKYEQNQIEIQYLNQELIDTNSNNKIDKIKLNYNIKAQIGNYTLTTILKEDNKELIIEENIKLTNTNQNISETIDINKLVKKDITSPTIETIFLTNKDYNVIIYPQSQIRYNLTQIETTQTYFTKQYTTQVQDTNNNSLYDNLQINLETQINKIGEYKINLLLQNEYKKTIKQISQNITINNLGQTNIPISIQGEDIYKKQINGPYKIIASIYYDNNLEDSIEYDNLTKEYLFTHFEKPKFPDLKFTKFNLTNTTLNFSINNSANIDAFGVTLIIMNETYDNIFEKLIPYIKSSQQINYSINVSPNTTYTGILDYYNTIEEINENNNFAFYPPQIQEENITENILYNISIKYQLLDNNILELKITNNENATLNNSEFRFNSQSYNLKLQNTNPTYLIINNNFNYNNTYLGILKIGNHTQLINISLSVPQILKLNISLEQLDNNLYEFKITNPLEYTIKTELETDWGDNSSTSTTLTLDSKETTYLVQEHIYEFPQNYNITISYQNQSKIFNIRVLKSNTILESFSKLDNNIYEVVLCNLFNTTQFIEFFLGNYSHSSTFEKDERKVFIIESEDENPIINYLNY